MSRKRKHAADEEDEPRPVALRTRDSQRHAQSIFDDNELAERVPAAAERGSSRRAVAPHSPAGRHVSASSKKQMPRQAKAATAKETAAIEAEEAAEEEEEEDDEEEEPTQPRAPRAKRRRGSAPTTTAAVTPEEGNEPAQTTASRPQSRNRSMQAKSVRSRAPAKEAPAQWQQEQEQQPADGCADLAGAAAVQQKEQQRQDVEDHQQQQGHGEEEQRRQHKKYWGVKQQGQGQLWAAECRLRKGACAHILPCTCNRSLTLYAIA